MYFAHSVDGRSQECWQPLAEHLHNVANLAGTFARNFNAQDAARLAGLLHDLGKYSKAFQDRLIGGARVDHSTAGAVEVRQLANSATDLLTTELIAYAIAGHHAGLGDKAELADRLKRNENPADPVWRQEIHPVTGNLWPRLKPASEKKAAAFQLGFLGRMIFSCLVDADFRDTENFFATVDARPVDRTWPFLADTVDALLASFNTSMEKLQAEAGDTPVNRLRREVLEHVRSRSVEKPGIFTLTVPTGGGKTLASLAFALDHAKRHGLERIVYAIPFTSVIDQTAEIFRTVLGDGFVLEHHSSIDEEKNTQREARDKLRLATEDWAAPVVVTTNVQLFESLFSNRPSHCRKLHNLARSVIVLDEAQTIPLRLLRPCVTALQELARNYGTSIVLCTATQPALTAPQFEGGFALGPERELAPDPDQLAKTLKRVTLHKGGVMNDGALITALAETPQGLVIVNSRAHALVLYRAAIAAELDGVIHLTTRQYAAHRRRILQNVHERLQNRRSCRLIATSLVEAGIDLDFPRVWRAEAGLDQIAQAAGRCNREGKNAIETSIVTIFKPQDHKPPREIRQLAEDFARMADKFPDLLSLDAIRAYFGEVYWRKGAALDAKHLLDEFKIGSGETFFNYRTVAENFRMIESGLASVIIAKDDPAKNAIAMLSHEEASAGKAARLLQPYVVQVPPRERNRLLANKHVDFVQETHCGDQFAVLRTESLYRDEIGLLWEEADYLGDEPSIF